METPANSGSIVTTVHDENSRSKEEEDAEIEAFESESMRAKEKEMLEKKKLERFIPLENLSYLYLFMLFSFC